MNPNESSTKNNNICTTESSSQLIYVVFNLTHRFKIKIIKSESDIIKKCPIDLHSMTLFLLVNSSLCCHFICHQN